MKFLDIPADIGEYVTYDPSFSTGLMWIKAKSFNTRNRKQAGSTKYKGKTKTEKAATELTFNGKVYKTSRIVWFLHFGPIPEGMVIDHLNGNPWDNRIENLACKTQKQNMQNQRKRLTNVSGVTGVYKTIISGNTYWVGFYEGKSGQTCKAFSCKILGNEEAKRQAIEFRQLGVLKINIEGESYTKEHGVR